MLIIIFTHMEITIINGPNLNLLGKRETSIYGKNSFEQYLEELKDGFPNVLFNYHQSNIEGELVDLLQQHGFEQGGIILNAGGYTHTSVSMADAIAAIKAPVIEVHISNIFAREEMRHTSLIARNCIGVIAGLGLDSYRLAVEGLLRII